MAQVAPAGPVYQAGTLSGNPLAMAAGGWALSKLTPALYARLDKLGARLAAGLADAAREAGTDVQINRLGSVLTPFFTTAPVRDYEGATAVDTAAYARFFRGMLARGVYPPPFPVRGLVPLGRPHRPRRRRDGGGRAHHPDGHAPPSPAGGGRPLIGDSPLGLRAATRQGTRPESVWYAFCGALSRAWIAPTVNVLLAEGINLGLRKMAEATTTHGFWELMRIARWHVEGEAYDRALSVVVEAQAALPMAAVWGTGRTASSDGQFSSRPPAAAKPSTWSTPATEPNPASRRTRTSPTGSPRSPPRPSPPPSTKPPTSSTGF